MNLLDLLRRRTPFIDVRSPAEFARGAFPSAVNLPILDDADRAEVGLTYRRGGQTAAIERGHQLVSGDVREQRIAAWRSMLTEHPDAWLYCWRGGLRSQIATAWLAESGVAVPRVPGGFKALRRACLTILESPPNQRWWILSGRTGSGKTRLLRTLSCGLDLEGHANHRGSAFGGTREAQPSPVDFEHRLVVDLLARTGPDLVLEDESRTIGRLAIPAAWHTRMQRAPRLVLEIGLEERAANIRSEYVDEPLAAGESVEALQEKHLDSLNRIRRRLGDLRYERIRSEIENGFATGRHQTWIESLLRDYYDPMYDYQLSRRSNDIVLRGDAAAVRDFLASLEA